jgi:hypothetical protein
MYVWRVSLRMRMKLSTHRPAVGEMRRASRRTCRKSNATPRLSSTPFPSYARVRFLSAANAFHGRVLATCSAVSQARRAVAMP